MPRSFKVARDIRYRVIENEAVVVRQREGDVVVLNQVAARVLELVGEGLSEDRIGDQVVSEYEAPEAAIRADVEAFLGELEELKVIEPIPAVSDGP
jgi:hypothetical protein